MHEGLFDRDRFDTALGSHLKDRGEAHITEKKDPKEGPECKKKA